MRLLLITLWLYFLSCTAYAQSPVDWDAFKNLTILKGASPEEQALELTAGLSSDLEKAAILYYFIAIQFQYDHEEFDRRQRLIDKGVLGKEVKPGQAYRLNKQLIDEIWEEKKGVCHHFTLLYENMAKAAGLEVRFISGLGRNDLYRPAARGDLHAWNAVRIDGEWRLLDATWAMTRSDKGTFFNPEYFCPPAEEFAYTHLPDDSAWQLFADHYDAKSWRTLPGVGTAFMQRQVDSLSHTTLDISIPQDQDLTITGKANPGLADFAVYRREKQRQEKSSDEVKYTMVPLKSTETRQGDWFTVTVPAAELRSYQQLLVTAGDDAFISYRVRRKRN